MDTLEQFMQSWQDCPAKQAFGILRDTLAAVPGVVLSTKLRPGVSISLRGGHPNQQGRELFVMVDIIDDDPENRWLSVCFYDDMVSDPQERGDFVPKGLLGEDARCFDLDEADEDAVGYVAQRIREAGERAARA